MKKFMLVCALGASLFANNGTPAEKLDKAINNFCGPEEVANMEVKLDKANKGIVELSSLIDGAIADIGSSNFKRGKGKDVMDILKNAQNMRIAEVKGIKKHLEICKKYNK